MGSNMLPCGSRRIALSWVGGGAHPSSEGAAGVWEVLSAGPGRALGSFRLKNVGTGEYLYIGSTTLPCDSRRLVLTWVGGGEVEGDNGVWTIPKCVFQAFLALFCVGLLVMFDVFSESLLVGPASRPARGGSMPPRPPLR